MDMGSLLCRRVAEPGSRRTPDCRRRIAFFCASQKGPTLCGPHTDRFPLRARPMTRGCLICSVVLGTGAQELDRPDLAHNSDQDCWFSTTLTGESASTRWRAVAAPC